MASLSRRVSSPVKCIRTCQTRQEGDRPRGIGVGETGESLRRQKRILGLSLGPNGAKWSGAWPRPSQGRYGLLQQRLIRHSYLPSSHGSGMRLKPFFSYEFSMDLIHFVSNSQL